MAKIRTSIYSETNYARRNRRTQALTTVSDCWKVLGLKPLLRVEIKPEHL